METAVIFSRHGSHARRSGYDVLAEHLQPTHTITAPRGDRGGWLGRLAARLGRAGAASRWFQGSSAHIEWQAYLLARRRPLAVLHYLWADHDVGYLPARLKRANPGTRLVGTLHLPPRLLTQVMRRPEVWRHFDALILMCEEQAAFLRGSGLEAARLHVLPHGIDTTFFHPAAAHTGPPFRVISVGSHLRDFDLLYAVCAACQSEAWRFSIVGPAAQQTRFSALANVDYHRGISDEELAAAYRNASCLLLTLTDATANNALLEAMASGIPVVSEAIGGIPDYVDAACARLCPPKDLAALIAALRSLADAPDGARAMGRAARERAETLTWERIAARTRDLYRELAGA